VLNNRDAVWGEGCAFFRILGPFTRTDRVWMGAFAPSQYRGALPSIEV